MLPLRVLATLFLGFFLSCVGGMMNERVGKGSEPSAEWFAVVFGFVTAALVVFSR